MSSQTSLVAQQCRLQSWVEEIKDCKNRPKGMSVDEWCIQNNIKKTSYYYHLRCVRQACLDHVSEKEQTFIEVPLSAETSSARTIISEQAVSACIHISNAHTLEIYECASSEFIKKLLEAITYAE